MIARVAVHEHQERRLAVDPQCAGGDEGPLDAVRAPLSQHLAHRQDRLAPDFMVGRNRVEEKLDSLRRVEPPKDRKFGAREPHVLATSDPLASADSHAPGSYATTASARRLRPCDKGGYDVGRVALGAAIPS